MKDVSIAEGKKGFSRYIRDAVAKDEEIIITNRGRPVAVIIPYERYRRAQRMDGYKKIMEARAAFSRVSASAEDIYQASRDQLEEAQ